MEWQTFLTSNWISAAEAGLIDSTVWWDIYFQEIFFAISILHIFYLFVSWPDLHADMWMVFCNVCAAHWNMHSLGIETLSVEEDIWSDYLSLGRF